MSHQTRTDRALLPRRQICPQTEVLGTGSQGEEWAPQNQRSREARMLKLLLPRRTGNVHCHPNLRVPARSPACPAKLPTLLLQAPSQGRPAHCHGGRSSLNSLRPWRMPLLESGPRSLAKCSGPSSLPGVDSKGFYKKNRVSAAILDFPVNVLFWL